MKKLNILVLSIILFAACAKEHSKDYASLAGKIENTTDSIISIYSKTGIIKTISIAKDGTFKDTIKVFAEGGLYTLQTNPTKRAPLFLKNGYNLTVNAGNTDADFLVNFKVTGEGAENSNFIIAQIEKSKELGNPQKILDLNKEDFDAKLASIKEEYNTLISSYKNIDSALLTMANQQTKQLINYFESNYSNNTVLGKGNTAPKFTDYIDYNGGKKSLDSFKGKFVYIDVWATWCGPCIAEIPSLKRLEKEYHTKNIEFISISIDEARRNGNSWEAAENKWRSFVADRNLTGVQLWAEKDVSLQRDYKINGIPRFILIDPAGNIVAANAPRPSDPSLKELFTSLGL